MSIGIQEIDIRINVLCEVCIKKIYWNAFWNWNLMQHFEKCRYEYLSNIQYILPFKFYFLPSSLLTYTIQDSVNVLLSIKFPWSWSHLLSWYMFYIIILYICQCLILKLPIPFMYVVQKRYVHIGCIQIFYRYYRILLICVDNWYNTYF